MLWNIKLIINIDIQFVQGEFLPQKALLLSICTMLT